MAGNLRRAASIPRCERRLLGTALAALAAVAAPAGLAAQAPAAALPAVADSLNPDTFRTVLPPLGPPAGPQPRHTRYVFGHDELRWSGAFTLGELLLSIPGAFLIRAGWYGQPEAIAWAGQGAFSVEVFWDGFALDPMGDDSAGLDVGRIPLGLLSRVEVEVLPTKLRVFLVSDVQPVTRPRTEASFATGDAQTNSYRGRYLNRWANGLGLGLAADFFGTDGPQTSRGSVQTLTLWSKATWTPSSRVGVEFQVMRLGLERESQQGSQGAVPIRAADLSRRETILRAYAASAEDGMGLRFDAAFGSSSYSDSTGLEVSQEQVMTGVSYRAAAWSTELTSRLRSGRRPVELRVRASWAPLTHLVVSGYGERVSLSAGGSLSDAGASGDLALPLGLRLHGGLRFRDYQAPSGLPGDTSQRVTDWSWGVTLVRRTWHADVSLARHGRFVAPAYGMFAAQVPRHTAIDVVTLTASFSIRPRPYFTLHGWYRHPLDPIQAAWEPAHHTRVSATFRSRFLPHFRRGAFDLLAEATLEGWSDGTAGLDASGNAIGLEGATVINYRIEFRLVGALLYWTLINPALERYAVVPGFPMARGLQRFGVRWEFAN